MPLPKASSAGDLVRCLDLDDFDLRLDRYRLIQPKADQLMARSLSKYSQLAPVVYCELEGALVLIDGFKRLRAARTLKGLSTLQARSLEVDEHGDRRGAYQPLETSTGPKRPSSISIASHPSRMNWKSRGSSMLWYMTMGYNKSKWLSCWDVTSRGLIVAWLSSSD